MLGEESFKGLTVLVEFKMITWGGEGGAYGFCSPLHESMKG